MTEPREALLARFRAGLIERVLNTQRLIDGFQATSDRDILQRALGELHTLKGESRMLGLSELSELAHALETELGTAQRFDLALGAFDAMLGSLHGEGDGSELTRALGRLKPTLSALPPPPTTALPLLAVERQPLIVEADDNAAAPGSRANEQDGQRSRARFVQVEAEQIDALCERVAELTAAFGKLETQADLAWGRERHGRWAPMVDGFERCRSLLEDTTSSTWRLRLVPVEPILQELARYARSAARQQQKLVEVRVSASGVQIERDVSDELWDSLLHLVQNAVDHGLEAPDGRGDKPTIATITLHAESIGPSVTLRVEDDGRGLDPEELRRVAVERGVLTAENAASLSDADACQLVFEHGFSTRREMSRTSGRGVGLDVVRRRIESLGGSVTLLSLPRHGSRFSLTVPSTITKEKLLVFELGATPYGLPARVVRAVLSAAALPTPGQDRVVRYEGELLPFRSFANALGLPHDERESLVLVCELSGKRVAAGVRHIIGERELIRRPAEKLLHATGIGASGVLEDGRIVLLPELGFVGRALRAQVERVVSGRARDERPRQRVLVADDSPVVRELVAEILSGAGLLVEQAADGAAALESIREREPDLVVSDVEMPQMNGFDLLAEVRRRSQRLPVVMLSTRGSVEDRKRATRLGANAYLVKTDFHSEALLDVIRRFVNVWSA